MFPSEIENIFSIEHHALLYGILAQKICSMYPKEGKYAILNAIAHYGKERGYRMAERTKLFGEKCTMENFLVFGEWFPEEDKMEQKNIQNSPVYITHVTKCPWNSYWRNANLLKYGKFYCQMIDKSLIQGYNSSLSLDINQTLTNEGNFCKFCWNNINFDPDTQNRIKLKREWLKNSCKRSWEFHTAHLWWTCTRKIQDILKKDLSHIFREILNDFGKMFSQIHVNRILQYKEDNFSTIRNNRSKFSMIGFGNLLQSLFPRIQETFPSKNLKIDSMIIATTAEHESIPTLKKKYPIQIMEENNLKMLRDFQPDVIFFAPPPNKALQIIKKELKVYVSELNSKKVNLPLIYAFPPIPSPPIYQEYIDMNIQIVQILPNDIRYINDNIIGGYGHHFLVLSKSWRMKDFEQLKSIFSPIGKLYVLESKDLLPVLITRVMVTGLFKLVLQIHSNLMISKHKLDKDFILSGLNSGYQKLHKPFFLNSILQAIKIDHFEDFVNSSKKDQVFNKSELKQLKTILESLLLGYHRGIELFIKFQNLNWKKLQPIINEMVILILLKIKIETLDSIRTHIKIAATKGGLLESACNLLDKKITPVLIEFEQNFQLDFSQDAYIKEISEICSNISQSVLKHGLKLL